MNFDEALAILGVDGAAGKKAARRAYLKLIKVHKPDRDPVMFRRVREAYECVKGRMELFERLHTPAPEPAPPPRAEPDPEPPAVLENTAAYDALLERDPEDRPASAPIVERVRAEPAEIDPREPPRVDLLDDALRVEPIAERPIRIEPRSAPPSAPPAPVYRAPARAFERGPSPAALLARAWAIFNDGGAAQAVERLARRAFAVARVDPEADQPPPADAINLCLALFTNGRVIPARRLTRAMRAWLSETGLERRVMGDQLAARLAILQALVDLPPDSPAFPIARIARAMRDGALDSAHAPLRRFTHETPYSALTSADHFRAHAPLLDGLYGALLRAGVASELEAVTEQVPERRGRGRLWFGGFLAVLFLIGLSQGTCHRSPVLRPPSIEMPRYQAPITMPRIEIPAIRIPRSALEGGEGTTAPTGESRTVWTSILCRVGEEFDASTCATAGEFDAALRAERCDDALRAIRVLEHTRMPSAARRGAVVLARGHYEQTCPKR